MVLPLIAGALTLATEFGPGLVRLIAGDGAGDVADKVVQVAKDVTGAAAPDEAAALARANPELAAELRKQLTTLEVSLEQTRLVEETKRLQTVNETIRTEARSDDSYVRRWRPTWGYLTGWSWFIQSIAIAVAIVWSCVDAGNGNQILTGLASLIAALMPMWAVALAMLGINIQARSRDKQVAAGQEPPSGLIGSLVGSMRPGRPADPPG